MSMYESFMVLFGFGTFLIALLIFDRSTEQ
ncbi:putative holin-like toxin [Gracilibacillus sp. S3-1-1]|uniref:Holin-like toxin n=1 Tax=Gracilibacillus pellucidus TaxID=3095368 RepID=A0ACC6M325_9BACI|nr:putative holin-like toxin [Gracilibacillus sp. S3-1-1]MDX8045351.1 putative holin-like toxin [Gracilibacillus sp. S3-1-1]